MLDHLGEKEGSNLIVNAIEETISIGNVLTKDLGGNSNTEEVTNAIIEKIKKL
jgi:isocitrate/isopropylmalate dehydrogenase